MSPIIDLQRRMVEVGRLRMGHQVASSRGRRPAKLEHWRLTSRDETRLQAAAELYGGEVKPWEDRAGEYELYTGTAELPILLIPGQTLSQWYETWSAGGCTRRCDGDREVISEGACICDTEKGDRSCKPTTRLSVMLPDVPGLGCWRLESHGYYAAVELAGTATMLEAATARGQLLPARLRIDQRTKVEGGKTTRYAVPVIDIDITVRQALPAVAGQPELERTFTPILPSGVTVEEGLAAVEREAAPPPRNGRQAAAIGPTTETEFSSEPIPVEPEQPSLTTIVVINEKQRALLWATVTDAALPEEALRSIVNDVTGQTSTSQIPASRFDQILGLVQQEAEIAALSRSLEAIGEKTGKLELVREKITANRAEHADDLGAHAAWLKDQISKAAEKVPA